ncbi:MAG: Aminomethyltransferase [Acidimicrobiales bacterium]|nr:Aminomethyltransferase [Acidimicrobiales bacterium]
MVPFGGWEMPLSYPGGTLAEHRACRTDAAVFDVSHLGTVRVSGAGALEALQRALTNDLQRIEPGRAQYTHLLDLDGSVLDDIIIWWLQPELFHIMPNASNTQRVVTALQGTGTAGPTSAVDITDQRAVLAIQGPRARERLEPVTAAAASVGRFQVASFEFDGVPCTAAGTGYTGEDGVECAVPSTVAGRFWEAVLEAGVEPAGLGARDTLRLEAGLPLHGHELGPGITPLNARLGWVISWDKGDFTGREALERQQSRGVDPVLKGIAVQGRRPPRAGQDVLENHTRVGTVSSGNYSPTLGHGIALAFLEPGVATGDRVEIDARGLLLDGQVVELPFVKRR